MGIAPKNPNPPAWSFGTLPGQPTTKPISGKAEKEPTTDEERLKRLISRTFGIDEKEITANAHMVHDLELDSLDLTELAMDCEEEFGIDLNCDCFVEQLLTFDKWLKAITEHKQGATQCHQENENEK